MKRSDEEGWRKGGVWWSVVECGGVWLSVVEVVECGGGRVRSYVTH